VTGGGRSVPLPLLFGPRTGSRHSVPAAVLHPQGGWFGAVAVARSMHAAGRPCVAPAPFAVTRHGGDVGQRCFHFASSSCSRSAAMPARHLYVSGRDAAHSAVALIVSAIGR
jgi:hypothetical protein